MIKKGRTDSIEVSVLIHAPPIPKDKSNRGPTQQTDAPMAANTAPNPSQEDLLYGVSVSVFTKDLANSTVMNFRKESKPCSLEQSQASGGVFYH